MAILYPSALFKIGHDINGDWGIPGSTLESSSLSSCISQRVVYASLG